MPAPGSAPQHGAGAAGGGRPDGGTGWAAHRLTELPSGVRVATAPVGSALSTAIGIWVGTGARHERDPEAGRAHLLEHMLFRGTASYESAEIDRRLDALGGDLNAATSRDETAVVARVLTDEVEGAFPILAEMVGVPRLTDDDLEIERRIVLEEIAMIDDDPEELVFELLPQAVFGGHALGRPVIGTPGVVSTTTGDELRAFHAGRYRPEQVVVAAAGGVDHDRLCALAEAMVLPPAGSPGQTEPEAPAATPAAVVFRERTTEQVQFAVAARGPGMGDDRRYALRVLDTILGGTPSSRLFRAVREDRGLAYAVATFDDQHRGGGLAGVYLGTRGENLAEAVEVVAAELERIRTTPVDDDELDRARRHARSRLLLAMESTHARMHVLGRSVLHGLPLLDPDEVSRRIDAVTADEVRALAAELYAPDALRVAGVGPDEAAFRAALAPLAPGLAEAPGT